MKRGKEHYIVNNKINIFYQIRDLLLTLMFWGLWMYIFYPFVALILWKYFDINIFYNTSQAEIKELGESLYAFMIFSGIIIFFLILSFIGWGFYNKKRFQYRGNKRRLQPKPISSEVMGQALHVSPAAIDQSKEARYVQIYHTKETPTSTKNLFKSINDLNVPSVKLYFSDDWDEIRETSNFGYTHIPKEQERRSNSFGLQSLK